MGGKGIRGHISSQGLSIAVGCGTMGSAGRQEATAELIPENAHCRVRYRSCEQVPSY